MIIKEEEAEKIKLLKAVVNKTESDVYLQSIAESLAIIAHKIGRKLP